MPLRAWKSAMPRQLVPRTATRGPTNTTDSRRPGNGHFDGAAGDIRGISRVLSRRSSASSSRRYRGWLSDPLAIEAR